MESLGQFLKSQREVRGYSLEDAQEATKIQIKYLRALEEERFEVLPGEVFTKGFIRSYADFLGINPKDAMTKYQNLMSEKYEKPIQIENPPKAPANKEKEQEEKIRKSFSWPIIALTIAIVIFGVWLYSQYALSPRTNIQDNSQIQQGVNQPGTNQSTEQLPEPESSQQQEPLPAPVYVKTTIIEECWLEARIDGKKVFEGKLSPNSVREWQGQQQIDFRFGNAGGVKIEYNGKDLGFLGSPGEVINRTFFPDQPAAQ